MNNAESPAYPSGDMPTCIDTLTGEWEIVTPEQVIAERAK